MSELVSSSVELVNSFIEVRDWLVSEDRKQLRQFLLASAPDNNRSSRIIAKVVGLKVTPR
jgi:hypothetical protein